MEDILNHINQNPISSILQYNGLFSLKRCKWCYNTLRDNQHVFCSKDCEEEMSDFYYINRLKYNREYVSKRYNSMTPEERKEFNRKVTLKRNPNAKQRSHYKSRIK